MNKIKVLEIIGDSHLGGAPRHLLSIVENIDHRRFDLSVICPPGPLAGEIRGHAPAVEVHLIKMRSRLDLEAIKKIRRVIREVNPQIIHAHGTRGGFLGRLSSIGFNKKVIYTEHLWTQNFHLSNPILNFFHYNANWLLDLFTTLNIAVSAAVRDFLLFHHISTPEKIKIIYNGIAPTKYRAHPFSEKDQIKLISVASLDRNKGIQFLLKALPTVIKEFPHVQLQIIGDGEYKRNLVQMVKKNKLNSHVVFRGFVPDIDKVLARADLYLQPSLSESFGLAIVQAMSVGLPIVASRAGGIPEVVTEEKAGILVEPGDARALAEGILTILRNPEEAKKMGEFGSRDARVRFNLKDMIIALETTYEEIAANTPFAE